MSTSTLGLVQLEAGPEPEVTSGAGAADLPAGRIPLLQELRTSQLRRLNLPDAADTSDTWRVTTSSGQGWLDRHSGALLACRGGYKVVPIAHDSGYFWARRGLLKKRGVITVVIGKPIDCKGRDPREVNAEAQEWVEATVKAIRGGADQFAGSSRELDPKDRA